MHASFFWLIGFYRLFDALIFIEVSFQICFDYCIDVCPKKVISLSGELNDKGYETVKFDTSGCIACGSCYTVCPDYAITIIKKEG